MRVQKERTALRISELKRNSEKLKMPSQAEKDERVHADRYLPITYVAIWFTVLLIAAFLRFASLSEQSLWSDEIQTIELPVDPSRRLP